MSAVPQRLVAISKQILPERFQAIRFLLLADELLTIC